MLAPEPITVIKNAITDEIHNYANDYPVMKCAKVWDDVDFMNTWTPKHGKTTSGDGLVLGGSGEVWHYIILWVGS